MSDAADRRIAELEMHIEDLERRCENQVGIIDRDLARIKELEAKLVQRDVYEAEQRLPPEHAVLIKHLATVERCIDFGAIQHNGYYDEDTCLFCESDTYWDSHNRDCPWLVLQLERGVTSAIDDSHAVALRQHQHRERQRMPREPAGPGATLEQMNNIFREVYAPMHAEDIARAVQAVERSREQTIGNMRVYTNPNVAPGTVYVTNLSDFQGIPALRQEPAQLVHGEWPDRPQTDEPVAPPDDEDVP